MTELPTAPLLPPRPADRAGAGWRRARERLAIGARMLTAGARAWPDFLIIGAQKCGTTFLYRNLAAQPGFRSAYKKEIHYFDLHLAEGPRWYRAHFPLRPEGVARPVTGESSPYYLFHPAVAERVAAALPDVRVIVVLREPVARAHSHYQHEFRRGVETLNFEAAIAAEPERLAGEAERLRADPGYASRAHRKFSYLARGHYAEQLERWLAHFPASQVLVLKSEAMYADPAAALARALRFLELGDGPVRVAHGNVPKKYDALAPAVRERLQAHFAPHNERLYRLLAAHSTEAHSLEIEPWA